jgi:hypothetical protein
VSVRSIISAPLRFYRYINEPGLKAKAQREAMSPAEREQWRIDSLRRNGFFGMFANLKPPKNRR